MSGCQLRDYFPEILTGGDIFLHSAEEILELKKTKYQKLALIKSKLYGKVLLLDNICQISEVDEFIYHELLVHVPAIFHGNPRNILILGGGDGCALREALKWKEVKNITLVDIDEEVIKCGKTHFKTLNQNSLEHPKATILIENAFDFVNNTSKKWDLIICDLSDPVDDGPAMALFTKEFFSSLKNILHPQGIISIQSGPAAPPDHFYFTRVANTLKTIFPYFQACISFCQVYLTPLAFSIVSLKEFKKLNKKQIKEIIHTKIKGTLKFLDEEMFFAALTLPKFLKNAIENEQMVYSLKDMPKWFGNNLENTL